MRLIIFDRTKLFTVRMKICSNVPGHMTKMASRPVYMHVKTFKNLLLRNQEADNLETWYTATGTQVLPNYSNDDTGLTLTISMTWSNLFPNASAWVTAYTAYSHVFPSLF